MGKGDRKTRKGKIRAKSYGKLRAKKRDPNKYIKISNLRFWSIEGLFAYVGRFDFTVNIQFKKGSQSYDKYGQSITGQLYFPKEESRLLNIKINSGIRYETDKNVRFELLLKKDLDDNQVKELFKYGFKNTDILNLDCYAYKHNKTYFNKTNKKLGKPVTIEISNDEYIVENFELEYGFYKMRVDKNDFLSEYEKLRMMALQKVLNIEVTEPKYIHNDIIVLRKEDYDFILEETLFYLGKVLAISESVIKNKMSKIKKIVDKEFEMSGINPNDKQELSKYLVPYWGLIQLGMLYQDKTILYSTHPNVTLNFEKYLHVVFRHSQILNIGVRNIDKSRIPYEFSETERLITECLQSVETDINNHFKEHPEKRFSKFGDDLIRYNGDYYEVQINQQGLIETFYNHKK